MRYWFFNFEGSFREGVSKHGCKGLFSNAMFPSQDEETAKRDLVNYLDEEGIDLVSIDDFFEYIPSQVDPTNKDNICWISMYEEAKKANGCVFTPWESFE